MVQYFRIPIDKPRYGFIGTDTRELVHYLLKDFGSEATQGTNEPDWMWNFTPSQRNAASILKRHLENSYVNHRVTLSMTNSHAEFLDKVNADYKIDYDSTVRIGLKQHSTN